MRPPTPAPSTAPADWLIPKIDLWAEQWVTGTVGPGFQTYGRLFHPPGDGSDAPRWADVAQQHGRVMHASAQWAAMSVPLVPGGRRGDTQAPRTGHLEQHVLAALCEILAKHTRTPDECWFAVWDGWGWQHPGAHGVIQSTPVGFREQPIKHAAPERQLDLTAPKFGVAGRNYHLFGGQLASALGVGHWVTHDWFLTQSPSMIWPQDHAWCVATEVDYDSTLVGGSTELINDIATSPDLEALQISSNAERGDKLNL